MKYRDGDTPVGVVVSAMRERQHVNIVALKELHTAHVDMQTTVFIGSSATTTYLDFMFTPRGMRGNTRCNAMMRGSVERRLTFSPRGWRWFRAC